VVEFIIIILMFELDGNGKCECDYNKLCKMLYIGE
jgi:hypothetical protein